jgi:hypothetical protein
LSPRLSVAVRGRNAVAPATAPHRSHAKRIKRKKRIIDLRRSVQGIPARKIKRVKSVKSGNTGSLEIDISLIFSGSFMQGYECMRKTKIFSWKP